MVFRPPAVLPRSSRRFPHTPLECSPISRRHRLTPVALGVCGPRAHEAGFGASYETGIEPVISRPPVMGTGGPSRHNPGTAGEPRLPPEGRASPPGRRCPSSNSPTLSDLASVGVPVGASPACRLVHAERPACGEVRWFPQEHRTELCGVRLKTISVSVDDGTHRLAHVRAAATGTTVSAMMREMLLEMLGRPATTGLAEAEPERRARLLNEVLERFRRDGIGVDTSQLLTRAELYDRDAAR